ncbi:MAG: flagellar biosynthesis protein FlhB [Treponema sp.]|nr:MAG: flagellar biosynthesis protein FlhB [Treponema sp.]
MKKELITDCIFSEQIPPYLFDMQWFAAEEEGRTEDPTQEKIRKARKEGRVAKSQEIPSSIGLVLTAIVLIALAPYMLSLFIELLRFFFTRCGTEDVMNSTWFNVFLRYYIRIILPIAIIAIFSGIVGNIIQTKGFLFSIKLIEPKFNKISPNIFKYFKRVLFSAEGLFNLAKSLIKVFAVGVIAYIIIKNNITNMISLLKSNLGDAMFFVAGLAWRLIIYVGILFLFFSVVDYFFQRKQFIESLKMTKHEIKDEFKESEGDPKIKGQIKRQMQDLLSRNAIKNVPQADVVITNPTHFAVALQYEEKTMPAPMVLAKGADLMAQQIKKIAKDNEIPIIENKPLTRAIYANVDLGEIIPDKYYEAVSLIFSQVLSMNEKKEMKYGQ